MKTFKTTLWAIALCTLALFSANDAGAVSSGADARALLEESAALVESAGFAEKAREAREQLAIVSDDELFDAYRNIDLEALVLAQIEAAEAAERGRASVEAARRISLDSQPAGNDADQRRVLQDADLEELDWDAVLGSGTGSTHPNKGKGKRSNTPESIANWNAIRDLRMAVQTAFSSLQVARDAFPVCDAAAGQTVVAGGIGVCAGGNLSAICMGLAIAVTVYQAEFTIINSELNYEIARQESSDYLDKRIDSAEIGLIMRRSAYLNEQLKSLDANLTEHDENVSEELEQHDLRVEAQLLLHDTQIKNQLEQHDAEIKVMLTEVERQIDLLLKTQLENMMASGGGARSGVAYQERLEEVCELASEAITSATNEGYKVHRRAYDLLEEGNDLMLTDPKRAHDACRSAFQYAATGSTQRLPGHGGRR